MLRRRRSLVGRTGLDEAPKLRHEFCGPYPVKLTSERAAVHQ